MKEPQKAALYIRVSTDEQSEYSPAAQQRALIDYAEKNGVGVLPEYIFIDEGFSGRTADKRPNFMRMIGAAKSKPKPFDVILVHKFDRFARNREDSIVYKSMLQREHGIKVISISETMDDSPMSILLEAMLEAIAEYYSINLAKEVIKGMTEKARQGGYQTTPPFGYIMTGKGLVVSEQEARHIRYIFNEYVHNDKTPREICIQINNMGAKTKRGNLMETRSIEYILHNPVYKGMVRWTPTERVRRNFHHPDSIISQGAHEPIISEEIFQAAAVKLAESEMRKRPKARPAAQCKHWLSGLMRCSVCGSSLNLMAKLKSFQCNGYVHGKCTISHSIATRKLEKAVLAEFNDAFGIGELRGYQFNITRMDDTSRQAIEFVRCQITKTAKKQIRARKAYLAEIDSLEEYEAMKKELALEKEQLEKELHDLEKQPEETADSVFKEKEKIQGIVDIITSDCDLQTKLKAIRSIIQKIVYSKPNETLEVYYYDL